jgi:hypothetical protein
MRAQINWPFAIAMQTTPYEGPCPIAIGLPGGGKTSFVEAIAWYAKRLYVPIILGNKRPEDVGGYPKPSEIVMSDGSTYEGLKLLFTEDMLRALHEKCVVIMDEINQAGDDLLAAAQEWIRKPPKNAWLCGAMNPTESSTNGRELSPPVVNRTCLVPWVRMRDQRRAGWLQGFQKYPAPPVPIVPEDFLDTLGPAWGQVMCDFEDENLELFGDEAYPKDPNMACNPFPSDRSWTSVGILMAACDAVGGDMTTKATLVEGCVGEAARTKFMQFLMHRGLPDFEALLAMPNTLKLPVGNYPMGRAILLGVAGRVMAEPTPGRWEAACDVLETAFDQQPETAMTVWGGLMRIKPQGYMPRSRNGSWKEMEALTLSGTK